MPKLIRIVAISLAILCTYPMFKELHKALCGEPDQCVTQAQAAEAIYARLPNREIILPKPKKCERDYAAIQALHCEELLSVLQQAGFTGDALRTAYAVTRAESSGRPRAYNGNVGTGDQSYGILQINMLGKLGPARRKQFGLKSNDELYDPVINAKVAFQMSGGGKNWRPWSAWKNGSYRKHLAEFDTLSHL